MKELTVNILVKDEAAFQQRFASELQHIAAQYDTVIQVCGVHDEEFKRAQEGITFLEAQHASEFQMYETLLHHTHTPFTVFFNEHIIISKNLLKQMTSYLKHSKKKVIATHIKTYRLEDGDDRKMHAPVIKRQKYMDFTTNVKNPLYFYRYIFQTKYVKGIQVQNSEAAFFKEKIILSFLEDFSEIKLLERALVYTDEPLETNINLYEPQYEKSWYLDFFTSFLLPYMQQRELNMQVQKMILYFLRMRYYFNLNGRDKFVLEQDDIDTFFHITKAVLQYIDDAYIAESRSMKGLPKVLAYLMLKVKHDGVLHMAAQHIDKKDAFFINDCFLGNNCIVMGVTAINPVAGKLVIDCEVMGDYFLEDVSAQLHVLLNGEEIEYQRTEVYNITKAFGRSINRFATLQFTIDEQQMNDVLFIEFVADFDGKKLLLPISYKKTSSRLIRNRFSYFTFGKHMIMPVKRGMKIKKKHSIQVFGKEIMLTFKTLRMRGNLKNGLVGAALRVNYWMTKKKLHKKENWIFFDKLYKGGDNAEYLFDYCYHHEKQADSYYVINKDAIDYPRLKEKYQDHVVEYNTLRHKLLVLHSDIIFATHASVYAFCGFGKSLQRCFRNLLKAEIVCIQHGLTIQSIAQHQNRLQDNTAMYFCASPYEIHNLEQKIYGYEQSSLYLTGCPRYDGLINHDQRQILIAPTWRRNIVITGNAVGTSKSYNPNFKHTKYFEVYNNLINDPRLLEAAKKYHYRLVFLIHPTLSSQVDDYDKNEYLSIVPAISDISYEKMLTESSLMLTDYSGIQFDFAYMKKPILYYHPNELPPQYQEGVYEYETMGFGPIIQEADAIISALCKQMEQGCVMENTYIDRVDDFFQYTDHHNCERIYNIIRKQTV